MPLYNPCAILKKYMKDAIIIKRKGEENPNSLYRRFTKNFRSSGILSYSKQNRYQDRKPSKNVRRKDCIGRLEKKGKFEEAYRLGKIPSHSVYKK